MIQKNFHLSLCLAKMDIHFYFYLLYLHMSFLYESYILNDVQIANDPHLNIYMSRILYVGMDY